MRLRAEEWELVDRELGGRNRLVWIWLGVQAPTMDLQFDDQ